LKHFDVFAAAGGKLKAVDRSVPAKAQDGALLIELQPVRGQALVSALSIAPAE
jgi:beta-galactosidase